METRILNTLITVVETGSLSAAAKRLGLTQGTVSRQISALEEELRTELFDHRNNVIILNDEGRMLLERAREIVRMTNECKQEIMSMNGELSGELRIGVGSFIEPYIRKAAIEFMKRHKKVLLKVTFGPAAVLNRMLHNEDIDLAFTMNLAYMNEGIVSKPCIPFRLSCIMPVGHRLADRDAVTYDDLMGCRVIMPDVGERVFQTVQRYMPDCDLSRLPVAAIVGNADAACKALEATGCVTFLPSEYATDGLLAKPIAQLDKELMSNAHWIKKAALKASAKEFINIIMGR